MTKTVYCEVCKGTYRVLIWRTPAGGKVRLCVLCRHTLHALANWQEALPGTALDSLIAQLPAYLPETTISEMKLWQQDSPTPGINSRKGQKYSTPLQAKMAR